MSQYTNKNKSSLYNKTYRLIKVNQEKLKLKGINQENKLKTTIICAIYYLNIEIKYHKY